MTKPKDLILELNQKLTTASAFLESYNKGIPASFPKASLEDLKQFEAVHPGLFKHSGEWSLEKHRKRLMDWLPLRTHK